MSGPGDDSMLDDYLKRDSDVSRRYHELDADGVPPELDRLVLDQARDAVEKPRRWMRWSAPIALAASTVLVVSIVIETGGHKAAVLNEVSAPQRPETAAAKSAPQPVAESPAASIESDQSVVQGLAVPTREREEPRASRAPVIPGEAHTPVMVVPVRPASPPPAPAPEAAVADAAAPAAEIPPSTPSASTAERKSEASVSGLARENAEEAGTRQSLKASNPEAWLESIRELRRDGKTAQAQREWSRFRKVFPDYPVAADDPAQPPDTPR